MAHTLTTTVSLGPSRAGLALSAQLVDTTGANVGLPVATGFADLTGGAYLWTYAGYPDGFRGAVVFSSAGAVQAVAAVNPEEAENADTRTSSLVGTLTTAMGSAVAGLLDLADGVEAGVTLRVGLRRMLAALAGKASGAATSTIRFRDMADLRDRITATTDAAGDRLTVAFDDG